MKHENSCYHPQRPREVPGTYAHSPEVRPESPQPGALRRSQAVLSAVDEPQTTAASQSLTRLGQRRCTATNKAGQRCATVAMSDSDVCLAHNRDEATARGFGGAQNTAVPKEYVVLRQRIEANVDRYLSPIERALDSDDPALALRAMAEAFDRVNGKAKQAVDVAHSGGLTLEGIYREALDQTDTMLPEGDAE